ncbi:alpha/beta hydrolase fold-3 domain protein [alpha proteobacterium U9-1i]|nr:alpha/beta hydrolase fold-3 domain protein [alpha proteobacterium U9-1i]
MSLDPKLFSADSIPADTKAVNEAIVAAMTGMAEWWDVGAAKVRAARESGNGPFPVAPKSPRARWIEIDGPRGKIKLRAVAPETSRGVYLHIHGGGHVLGAADQQDRLLEHIADGTHLTALSVEYRLAPENPFPAGPDDCEAAALWVSQHLADFGGAKLAIGGESAGAHLAALTILRLRDKHGLTPFHAANLVFGVFDLGMTPSARRFGDERLILRTVDIEQFGEAFLPGVSREKRRAPTYSPLYADLSGLCPALFTIGTRDALLDDSLFMHSRWVAAGNSGELAIYPGACHGFIAFPCAQTFASLKQQATFLNDVLA